MVEAPNSFSNLLDEEIRTVPLANLAPIHYDDQDKTDEHVQAETEDDNTNVSCLSSAEETAIAVTLDHFRYGFTISFLSLKVLDSTGCVPHKLINYTTTCRKSTRFLNLSLIRVVNTAPSSVLITCGEADRSMNR